MSLRQLSTFTLADIMQACALEREPERRASLERAPPPRPLR